ncbi:MAG: SRPBCC domain-containing protein [Cytophagia bacterium]|nr:SRPBCC domain-containing protein [Cytophagia bacterium]
MEGVNHPEVHQCLVGPEGFTNTIRTMNVREGGIFDFTMHTTDGTDFVNYYHYTEIKPLEKLIMSHQEHPKFNIEVELFPKGEQTKVT